MNRFTERNISYDHNGFKIGMTIWNESSAPDPRVLFDYNNVLNAYTMEQLQKAGGIENLPYAIVSLLRTRGNNYMNLRERAKDTGECIIAVTAILKGNRVEAETSLKHRVIGIMGWKNVLFGIDDKPHEWYKNPQTPRGKKLKLSANKKPVYKVPIVY